jgi:hypothetical protein
MGDPEQLFRAFVDSYRDDPSTDPREYLARLDGVDREELRVRIEAFLERAPLGDWDPEDFAGSMAERAIAAASPEFDSPAAGQAEGWSQLLPALRERARLKRATVVERLAVALGFPDSEERVADYYHRMERGQLPPSGVSTTVLEALGSILGATAASLRAAGEAGEPSGPGGGEVFARLGAPAEAMASPGVAAADRVAADRPEHPDDLDRLFIGGD